MYLMIRKSFFIFLGQVAKDWTGTARKLAAIFYLSLHLIYRITDKINKMKKYLIDLQFKLCKELSFMESINAASYRILGLG